VARGIGVARSRSAVTTPGLRTQRARQRQGFFSEHEEASGVTSGKIWGGGDAPWGSGDDEGKKRQCAAARSRSAAAVASVCSYAEGRRKRGERSLESKKGGTWG
jgi:hypothetical protein